MSYRRRTRTIGTLCLAAMSGLAFLVASGCSKSEAAPAPAKDSPAQVSGASSYSKDQYKVEMKLSGACAAGKECKAEISLESKGEFHINDKYPLKMKLSDPAPDGVSYTKAIVKKDDGKFEEKKGTLPVGFTLAKAGKAKVAGTFSFSVCSDANCVMEKLDLELEVEAK
ncbi:MAG: hypothetical protein R3B70_47185 [Polyangiaceae bacterium]